MRNSSGLFLLFTSGAVLIIAIAGDVGRAAGTDMLEIWNPYGQDFQPAGPDGLVNGYTTAHGRFKISLKDAYSFFSDFIFETATPLPPGTAPRW